MNLHSIYEATVRSSHASDPRNSFLLRPSQSHIDVSENSGTPKSSILIGFPLRTIHFGVPRYPYFWKHPYPLQKANTNFDKDDFPNRTYLKRWDTLEGTLWKINGWNLQITHLEIRKEKDLPNLHDYVPCQSSGEIPGGICVLSSPFFRSHPTTRLCHCSPAKSFRPSRWKVPWIPPISMTSVVWTSDSPFIRKDTRRVKGWVGVCWRVG